MDDTDLTPQTNLEKSISLSNDEVRRNTATALATREALNQLSHEQVTRLLAMSATHTVTELSREFGITVPSVTGLLQRRGLAAVKAERLNDHAHYHIATSDKPAVDLAAAFGISVSHVYHIKRAHKATEAPPDKRVAMIGYKVTEAHMNTILDLSLSTYEAAKATGLSVPTVYNYRRKARDTQSAVGDLV